jgi:hypothetical protein
MVLDYDVLLEKRNLLEVHVENEGSYFILEF